MKPVGNEVDPNIVVVRVSGIRGIFGESVHPRERTRAVERGRKSLEVLEMERGFGRNSDHLLFHVWVVVNVRTDGMERERENGGFAGKQVDCL